MRTVLTVVQMLIRLDALVLLILGLLFWTGNAANLIPIHMLLGIVLVILLWVMAALGAINKQPIGLVAAAAVWGVVVVWLGLNQDSLLPGGMHWIIQVLHLLVGVAAVGLAEALGGRIRRSQALVSAPASG